MNIIKSLISELSINSIDILKFIIPFIFGLFASLIIYILRDFRRNKKNKKFIINYLYSTILPNLIGIKLDYNNVKNNIETYSQELCKVQVFESFNSNVINAIKPFEYYEIFKSDYTLFNEISSTIDYLSKNLPLTILNEYYEELNNHLSKNNAISDLVHEKHCPQCLNNQARILKIVNFRINEVEKLQQNINLLIK